MNNTYHMLCGAVALTLAGAATPARAAFGPSGCLLNHTDLHLILTFDPALATPGNFFHLLHVKHEDKMAVPKVKSGKGSAIPELAAQEILFGPGDRIFLMQDTAGITGTSVRAGFKFQLHLDGASRTIPAQVVFTFDYPVAGSGGVSAVAIDGVFPAEYSTAHRFAFTRTEGKRELVLSKLPDHVPAHGPAAARHDDSWHRGYRQQAPKAEDPAAVALRQFQQGAEEKKGPAVPAEKADDAD